MYYACASVMETWTNLYIRGVNPGVLGGRDPQILGWRGRERVAGVVKHYYILLCTGSKFKSGDFWKEIEYFGQEML